MSTNYPLDESRLPGAPHRSPEEVTAIVKRIADQMLRGAWVRGLSGRALAKELGDAPMSTIRDYVAQATRMVWDDTAEDIAELKASTISRLGVLSLKAESKGDLREANNLLRTQNEIGGTLRGGAVINLDVRQLAQFFDTKTGDLTDAGRAKVLEDVRPGVDAILDAAVEHLPADQQDDERERLRAIGARAVAAARDHRARLAVASREVPLARQEVSPNPLFPPRPVRG